MDSDVELLDRWTAGDERAGKTLVERHYSAVFRFFRAKGVAEIDDILQDTFLALVQGHAAFRGESSFRAYLFGTARNVLRHYYRRRGRKEDRVDFGTQSVVDLGASPSVALAEKDEKRLLLAALRRIAMDDQIVLELYHWEDLSGPDLARVLGLTEAAVRSRLHRAKARLATALQEIAGSGLLLDSTLSDLDGWAKRVRDDLALGANRPP